MFKPKRFQNDEPAPALFNTRRRREQRRFAITVAIAVAVAMFAFLLSRGNKVLHLPFHAASAADTP